MAKHSLHPSHRTRQRQNGRRLMSALSQLVSHLGYTPGDPDPVVDDVRKTVAPFLTGLQTLTVEETPRVTLLTAPPLVFARAYFRGRLFEIRRLCRRKGRIILIVPPRVLTRRYERLVRSGAINPTSGERSDGQRTAPGSAAANVEIVR